MVGDIDIGHHFSSIGDTADILQGGIIQGYSHHAEYVEQGIDQQQKQYGDIAGYKEESEISEADHPA